MTHSTLRLRAGAIDFTCLAQGGEHAPLVLCLHGFPETPHTFDRLLDALAGAGYRAVAPFMRGYTPSSAAPDGEYGLVAVAGDVPALLDALGAERAVVVGHDWGAAAAYTAAALFPERIERLVALAIPHPAVVTPTLRLAWHARHFLGFQLRARTLARFRRDSGAFVDELYRRWSPTWRFDPQETAPIKRLFTEHPEGLEAAVAYYWSFFSDQRDATKRRALAAAQRKRLEVPTLAIAGEDDPAAPPALYAKAAARFRAPYRWVAVPGAGHFVHREAPERTLDEILRELGPAGRAEPAAAGAHGSSS